MRWLWSGVLLLVAACGTSAARADVSSMGPGRSAALVAREPEVTPTEPPTAFATPSPAAFATLAVTVAASATPAPTQPTPSPARVVDRGPAGRRFVALTFDAGADAGYTEQILDTLREQGVHASFGMTGRWAEQHPALLRRIVRDGHHLMNHSYDHGSFTGASTGLGPLSAGARERQLERTEEIVRDLAGVELRPYFRPPFGDYDASVNADVGARGYTHNVMWTVDSLGWRGVSAARIVERCVANASPGAILIFHVGAQSQDGPALPAVIEGLQRQGYSLGTVRDLLEG